MPYRANAGVARRVYSTAHPAGGDVEPGSYPCAPFLPTALRSGAGTYFGGAESPLSANGPHQMDLARRRVGLTRIRSLRYRRSKRLHLAV